MKAILNYNAVLAGLVAVSAIGTATAEIYDIEVLADGRILYAADFSGLCDPGDPECVTPPAVGVVYWDGDLSWQCAEELSGPGSAQRLADGSTLLADTGNNRVIEVDAANAFPASAQDGLVRQRRT